MSELKDWLKSRMKIFDLYKRYQDLSAVCDRLTKELEAHPEDIAIDDAWTKAYTDSHAAFMSLSEEVARLTGTDGKTARAIVCSDKFSQLMEGTKDEKRQSL